MRLALTRWIVAALCGLSTLAIAQQSPINAFPPGAFQNNAAPAAATSCSQATSFLARPPAVYTGTIATTVMTVTAITSGTIAVGQTISGAGITGAPTIVSLGTGTGGTGTYNISSSQTVSVGETITSGLDASHTTAVTNLICGLVTDSVFSKFDVLHIYATQDKITALLNLVSTSFNGTILPATPTFVADRGYTGVNGSASVDTLFNPTTASSPKLTQNSAHLSAWNLTNAADPGAVLGSSGGSVATYIITKFTTDTFTYFRINSATSASGQDGTRADPRGHYIGTRSASNAVQGYFNAGSIFTSSDVSFAPFNANINAVDGQQCAMISVGSQLSSTDATNFYNRLRTYMTAVGVP